MFKSKKHSVKVKGYPVLAEKFSAFMLSKTLFLSSLQFIEFMEVFMMVLELYQLFFSP